MSDTPAPLSADSLRDILIDVVRAYNRSLSDFRDGVEPQPMRDYIGKAESKINAHIAAALQSERQRIADSLIDEAKTYSNDGDFSDNAPTYIEAVPVQAVRAVLIPPPGSSPTPSDASAQGHEAITDNEEAR